MVIHNSTIVKGNNNIIQIGNNNTYMDAALVDKFLQAYRAAWERECAVMDRYITLLERSYYAESR